MLKVGRCNTSKYLAIDKQINQDLLQCGNTLLLVFNRRFRDQLSYYNVEVRCTHMINDPS